jgi:hypothetical protein
MFSFEELYEAFNNYDTLTITNEERNITIEPAENFEGGEKGFYMKDTINIMYDSPEEAIESAIEELGGIDEITDYWD